MSPLVFLLVPVLVIVLVLTNKFYTISKTFREVDNLPGPPTFPFLGNLLDLGNNMIDTHHNFVEFPRKYGELLRVWFGPFSPTLMVGKPEHIEYFLSSSVHITKSPGYDFIKLFIGNGLITSGGDYWRRHRKIITPTFHFKILEQFMHFITTKADILIDKLNEQVGKDVDVYPVVKMFALDTILQTAMNYNLDTMNHEGDYYVNAVQVFLDIFIQRFYSVILRINAVFVLTSRSKQMNNALKVLRDFTENIIKTRREERRCKQPEKLNETTIKEDDNDSYMGIKKRKAFLDLLLDISVSNTLTDEEIREEVDTFVFAGHDTISSSISFALFELAKYPHIQKKIYKESVGVLGTDVRAPISYRNLNDFKYLEMVIKESLRYNTTVPMVQRILDVDAELDGIKIPAGTQILISSIAIHMNPKYYPNPEVFDPDRFLPEISSKRHPYAFIPFSAGPRNCIGQKFAMMEMKLALVKIIRNFHLNAVVPDHKILFGSNSILKSCNGIPVRLSLRQ